jgi:hypothetical protein
VSEPIEFNRYNDNVGCRRSVAKGWTAKIRSY